MTKIIEQHTLNSEYSFDNEFVTDEKHAKEALNSLIHVIPHIEKEKWGMIFQNMNQNSTMKIKEADAYKVSAVKILMGFAKKHSWQLAKDGNKFYIYNGQQWVHIEEDTIKYFFKLAANKMGIPEWKASNESFVNHLYKQLILDGFFEKMITRDITHLNLQNGTLHIDTGGVSLQEFDAKNFLTHQLDFAYDKEAVNEEWLNFLDTALPDKDTQKTLQQSLGYLFTRDLKLEKAIFLYGTGSNGKSVIFEVLKGLISDEMFTSYSLESLTNSNGYQRAAINNKLINYSPDITMKKIDSGIFKQLVSGEPVGVRQIKEKPFIMKTYAKLIFNVNKLEDADVEATHGFFRRMVFIPFETTIAKEQQDKNLHKKILKNKAGVLNWIIEGIEDVIQNEEIFLSEKCGNFIENFRKESNLVITFTEEYEIMHTDPNDNGNTMRFQELYDSYRGFCKLHGEKPLSQRKFNAEMKKIGYEWIRRSSGNVWFAQFKQLNSFDDLLKEILD